MLPNAIARADPDRQPLGHRLAGGFALGQDAQDIALLIGAQADCSAQPPASGRVRAGDFADDVLQHGETQREDDGIGALQSVAIAAATSRSGTDFGGQQSCRIGVGAREPQVSPPEASSRAMADPIPPVPMIAVVMIGTLPGLTVSGRAARSIADSCLELATLNAGWSSRISDLFGGAHGSNRCHLSIPRIDERRNPHEHDPHR